MEGLFKSVEAEFFDKVAKVEEEELRTEYPKLVIKRFFARYGIKVVESSNAEH